MTDSNAPGGAGSRPVMALMGEFSAGKSTLANLLLGDVHSPVKVTATQLPPVWFSHGSEEAYQVDLHGNHSPISLDDLESVNVADTQCIRIFAEAEILTLMDLIDMPGNSDPNMSADVWRRMIHHADGVIWCTHANQAWRQSEAAVWDEMPPELHENSLLLLTRFDKIIGDKNRARVVRRVESETDGLFRGVYPIALLDALHAGADRAKWDASGAEAFTQALLDVVMSVAANAGAPADDEAAAHDADEAASPVMPRRVVKADGESSRPRPERQENPSHLH